jgi:diadenylate cyclase
MFNDLPNFITALRSYSWWQVTIELLIIGSVVFFALRFLQGTRGARMLKGVAFVLITLYLIVRLFAERFDLARIEFLYSKFLLFAYFAVVIVFQPELRRALMRLGETRLFRSTSSKIDQQIDAVVEAATRLARRRCGALIAIERDTGLGTFAESGTPLDAEMTPELIQTIFFPDSPLHDLGMIISNGRIAHAAVQFPLAEAGDLERELGSRHRAAVGLSQESDAVVVVVSEETGDISVAEKGQLFRKLSPESLRDLLSELLVGGTSSVSRTYRFPRLITFSPRPARVGTASTGGGNGAVEASRLTPTKD